MIFSFRNQYEEIREAIEDAGLDAETIPDCETLLTCPELKPMGYISHRGIIFIVSFQ
jgi:hypothetical protein